MSGTRSALVELRSSVALAAFGDALHRRRGGHRPTPEVRLPLDLGNI